MGPVTEHTRGSPGVPWSVTPYEVPKTAEVWWVYPGGLGVASVPVDYSEYDKSPDGTTGFSQSVRRSNPLF